MSRFWLVAVAALVSAVPLVASAQEPTTAQPAGDDEEGLEETGGAGGATAAQGEPATKGPEPRPHADETDEPGPEPPLVAPAPDTLGGHVSISPSVGVAFPFANLETGAPQSDAMSKGWAFGLDAAYGVSRAVAVGAWGQYLRLGAPDSCSDCKTQSTAFGAFVRYHLVQGMRFDPWMGAGLGYRTTKFPASAATSRTRGSNGFAFKWVATGTRSTRLASDRTSSSTWAVIRRAHRAASATARTTGRSSPACA